MQTTDELCSGLGASIARMVQYIQVETGGNPALFTDLERKCWTALKLGVQY